MYINGWNFDFENMIARRRYEERKIEVIDDGKIMKVDFKATEVKNFLRPFFDPPEDIFNPHINKAYHEWIASTLEKEVLK